jgi:hypothetical protein
MDRNLSLVSWFEKHYGDGCSPHIWPLTALGITVALFAIVYFFK